MAYNDKFNYSNENNNNNDSDFFGKMERKLVRRSYNHCGKALIGYFVLSQIFGILLLLMKKRIPYINAPELYEMLLVIITLVVNIVPFVICAKFNDFDYKAVIGKEKVSWNLICCGIATIFTTNIVVNITMNFIQTLLQRYGMFMDTIDVGFKDNVVANIATFLLIVVIAPITEEFIFRGVLFSGFSKFGGKTFAIVVTALLFSLLHGNFIQAIPAFIVGLILGYLRAKTGSAKSSIILHAINNGYAYIMMVFQHFSKDILENSANLTPEYIQSMPPQELLSTGIVSMFGLVSLGFMIFCVCVTIYIFAKRLVSLPVTTLQEKRNGYKLFFTSWAIIGMLVINVVTCIISIKQIG